MKIDIKNKILMDQDSEHIREVHDCDCVDKGDYTYLIYQNDEKEKVVIKFNQDEFVMTRFSNPKSQMRFLPFEQALVAIPTPVGIQHLVTDTSHYLIDKDNQVVELHYALKQPESQQVFAHYQLKVKWS
ncbi:DUF1934 domain-containing protein [Streptococcus saliviloxodontae]|uniref:Uncharacterized beta-barrel protein YwiB (DUF1934 family) n=1 Tax=Streptococcus saliviloxodontae TaxID=1349416 RepID=A0ABS2PNV6_9STRE|nr:DUF1934 domain-containing protein [Streptococcus saliviloxodontae]MBM7637049.1 uncharacterized beta-barrel protein YwiB (DUF1934 family) [Streptococcus saliviloxodontae]